MKKHLHAAHPVFRISERANESLDNPFFAAFVNQITDALIGDRFEHWSLFSSNYVCNRETKVSTAVIDALRTGVPEDVIEVLANQVPDGDLRYAYYEIDLIDFLINVKVNKVLSIVGSVGIGKSTFIDFIFRYLHTTCPSLNKFLPIKFNGLLIGDDHPAFSEIFHRLHLDCLLMLEDEFDGGELNRHSSTMEDFYQENTNSVSCVKVSSTTIIEYFHLLKSTLGCAVQPVLIFDNLDQMAPKAVAKFSHLARGIYLQTDFTIILCMRPPTFATHVEVDANKGAFYTFRINLPSPDITHILNKRLKCVFKSHDSAQIHDSRSGFKLTIKDPLEAINNLNRNILTSSNKELLVKGIACNNVRKALSAFFYYLRFSELDFRNLFDVTVGESYKIETHIRKHDWSEHFLTGLILGGNKYYKNAKETPVCNLLYAEVLGYDLDYCLKYRIITIFYYYKELVSVSKVTQLLTKIGYERAFVKKVMTDLLKNYLLVSPEHEYDLNHIEHASISDSGNYYYDVFLDNHNYLYELIFDVPLNHANWERDSVQEFEIRAMSVLEYLGRVISCERDHLKRIISASDTANLCAVFKSTGFLSRRILTIAKKIASIGLKASSKHVSNVANAFIKELDNGQIDVDKLEQELEELLKNNSYISIEKTNEKEMSWSLGIYGHLTIKYPDVLEPSGNNVLKTELTIDLDKEPDSLIAWLESVVPNDMKPSRMCSLERTDIGCYYGEIMFEKVPSLLSFPKSSLTILSDSRPLLTRELS